jgi:hypothetical protein
MNPRNDFTAPARTLLLVALVALSASAAATSATTPLRLENDRYLVEVTATNGVIPRIRDKQRGLELIEEPRLADNFKFTLPIRRDYAWQSTEGNFILGREQRLTAHRQQGSRLELEWGAPLRSTTGKGYNVSAAMTLELAGDDLRFNFKIQNASKLEIGEVYYPILGGTLGLGSTAEARRQTQLVLPDALTVTSANIFQTFANMAWLGIFGPEQSYPYPNRLSMPWAELRQPALDRSVYFGAHDPAARHKVLHLEMCPGVAPGRADGNWPRTEELRGIPAGVKFCFVHIAYQPAKRDFEATPVVLCFHDGDWHQGARIYGTWLASETRSRQDQAAEQLLTQNPHPRVSGYGDTEDWLSRTPVFQQCEAVPFKELARWAKAAAEAGVPALLLNRWSIGGTGNHLPRFEPDPSLGTPAEFVEAVRQCHTLGLKVGVVVNLTPISLSLESSGPEFYRYACQDRWGIPYTTISVFEPSPLTSGFGAGERCVWLNPGNPGMRGELVRQIKLLANRGIDGVHFQAFFARPADFNITTGRTPDRAIWEGGLETLRAIQQAGRSIRPEFAISTDSAWDRAANLTRAGFAEVRDQSPLRVAVPGWRPLFTVTDDDACAVINSALRYRGRLRVAPADNQPLGGAATAGIVEYLRAVITAREILHETLWEGEAADTASMKVDGTPARTVFRNPLSGVRTAVLINPGAEPRTVTFDGFVPPSTLPTRLWRPTLGTTNLTPATRFEIPGRQLALVTEETAADRLPVIARAPVSTRNERIVFDLASTEDLEGWTLKGSFSVSTLPGLIPKPTLNSIAVGGESATGTAISPPFKVDPQFDTIEIVMQGGWSEKINGAENLALRLVDATTGELLEEIVPPGTHELRTLRRPADKLHDRTMRAEIVDANRNGTYAWIGLRRLVLTKAPGAASGHQ